MRFPALLLLCAFARLFMASDVQQTLKPLVVLPNSEQTLTGRDAITAVFNKAVIALGSDWNNNQQPPFHFEGANVPGKIRWCVYTVRLLTIFRVTTTIARFDPDIDWPPDLKFSVRIAVTDYKVGQQAAITHQQGPEVNRRDKDL